jgi:hypothetical protein
MGGVRFAFSRSVLKSDVRSPRAQNLEPRGRNRTAGEVLQALPCHLATAALTQTWRLAHTYSQSGTLEPIVRTYLLDLSNGKFRSP